MSTKLMWITPHAEQMIVDMARVSAPQNQGKEPGSLIQYLITHEHWSPLEMANACFEINTTRDIGRQILRHRSFSFQEFSQRYADPSQLPDVPMREARLQDQKNRQASLETDDAALKNEWQNRQADLLFHAQTLYNWAISKGLAKEVARAPLPEGLTPTRIYMNGTIRSWIHFCKLRLGNGSQKEITLLTKDIISTLEKEFPHTWSHAMSV